MECSKKVNGECGKALNCVWCPEHIKKRIQEIYKKNNPREDAIKKHRKMWNWIADNQEKMELYGIDMKKRYLLLHEVKKITSYCYLCDFVFEENSDCDDCPIDWGNNSDCPCLDFDDEKGYDQGLFSKWMNERNLQEAAKLAREIANLPEKVIV